MANKKLSTAAPASTTVPAPGGPDEKRVTLPLTSDEKGIDWDKVRPSRRDALRTMLTHSGIAAEPRAAAADPSPVVTAAVCGTLYDLLAQLESLAATRVLGCTMDQAFAVLRFTAAEKQSLADPTTKVLNKYLPASLFEHYADEVMLALLLVTMTRAKYEALRDSLGVHSARPEVNTETHKN